MTAGTKSMAGRIYSMSECNFNSLSEFHPSPGMKSAGPRCGSADASYRWMRILSLLGLLAATLCVLPLPAAPRPPDSGAAVRAAYMDRTGVVRWRDSNAEVALYGANYCIMSGSDYRMAGLVSADRKAMILEDMAQFARMGWTALRLCSWGDWENADKAGNLILNEHIDLLDYLVAEARRRGIYILLTPIHTYNPAFADQLNVPTQNIGFSRYFERPDMGINPASIAAQVNY